MSRESAAANAMVGTSVKRQTSDAGELATAALAAADAHDTVHDVHRISLQSAAVVMTAERAWEALSKRDSGRSWSQIGERSQSIWIENVRNVLDAAVATAEKNA